MRNHFAFINGHHITGQEQTVIFNPYNAAEVAHVHLAGPGAIEEAVRGAAEAFASWRFKPAFERSELLRGVARRIAEVKVELAEIIKEEAGKPITLALGEVDRAVQTFCTAAEEALRINGEFSAFDSVRSGIGRLGLTRRFPLGPVLAISPFNFPLNLVAHKVAPALAAGNTVVLKPASQTPSVAIRLAELAAAAGVPEGVFNVVPCRRELAEGLVADPRLKALSFTGSAAVGWSLKARAGSKKVTLELGGNAAAIVEPDVDIGEAARKLGVGAFGYAGQVCISVQRIFVHESIEREFLTKLVSCATQPGLWGSPDAPATLCGPLIDEANAERIVSWIGEAVSLGGSLLCGGVRHSRIVTPAVLTKVPNHARIIAEEAFGPVVAVDTYRTFDEALAKVNDSRFGLQAGLFTNDITKLMKAFKLLEVGGLIHNDYPTFRVDPMPYGGVKESGFGREGLRYAIEELTELKLLVINESGFTS